MNICPMSFIRTRTTSWSVPADMKPAKWTNLPNAAIQVEIDRCQKVFPPGSHSSLAADAPATTKISVDTRLVNRRTLEQFSACEGSYRRSVQSVDGYPISWMVAYTCRSRMDHSNFECAGESTRFRKSGVAQNTLSVDGKYWSLDAWCPSFVRSRPTRWRRSSRREANQVD
ncbi:hypothetical protein M378DRAFT_338861 [Amanita muscaria Koide BX008]|uniref:Uncharacterized protein n=1 Tax=Amanita muscaria (strain Koide BX008) TaxID=946122 RepID=A0A0C2WN43_AMAMK|nr:hypothetical protein M378DRAFT_338861 [Amanita muscaria Koide BX008]